MRNARLHSPKIRQSSHSDGVTVPALFSSPPTPYPAPAVQCGILFNLRPGYSVSQPTFIVCESTARCSQNSTQSRNPINLLPPLRYPLPTQQWPRPTTASEYSETSSMAQMPYVYSTPSPLEVPANHLLTACSAPLPPRSTVYAPQEAYQRLLPLLPAQTLGTDRSGKNGVGCAEREPRVSFDNLLNIEQTMIHDPISYRRFIRNPDEDGSSVTWEQRVAKKYYDKLFKEYAICELKYYKENKVV
ncbi:hypothetical protein BC936DRAFT_143745 [Jimgerdemannia flammicorona]|uniref:Uncharacterized protein n=1 Tax=Jimgerdemannia flammicorona TaxID=994334 RepID=A0A433DDJ7_9FUNG|nr:hypothetical protein BC936DRAFT_143745 [Jimgerdemannia flammicorona]